MADKRIKDLTDGTTSFTGTAKIPYEDPNDASNKTKYLEIEEILRKIAEKLNLNLGELDLFLWYLETGKVLK